ncbi:unnamed protein product [Thelazia callipaeda]|uniref:GAB2 n=1 Tax=Thelazia callipaeda TaxID=103827 RepID=A0A0N5CW12_THECL|nr:unnamed protein product [Thelazia callipaeda]
MLKRIIVEEHQNPEKSSVAFDGRNKSKEFFRGYVVNQVSPSIHIFTNSVNYPNGLQFTVIPNNEKENFMQLHSNSTRNVERIDTKMYSSFCMHPLSHRSNHATKPGDEGGIPPRPLSSSQPHSLRIDSSDETCDHSCCAIDVLSAKMENLPAFVPRTPQRSESSGDDLVTTAEVTSSVIPQPVLASCDTSKTFIFKNITPYMRQTTTKPLAELVQPTVPQPTSIIANSVPSAQNLPLPHRSFSLPSTDTISSMPPQSTQCSYYDNSADIISCKDSLVAKEHHYCENTPRRLRLKTTDGPAYGLRTSYGRPGWHDNSRQSALPYPNSGTSRFYTRPAPSLPLLPLGQTQSYCRNGSRHATLNNFTNQQWSVYVD